MATASRSDIARLSSAVLRLLGTAASSLLGLLNTTLAAGALLHVAASTSVLGGAAPAKGSISAAVRTRARTSLFDGNGL